MELFQIIQLNQSYSNFIYIRTMWLTAIIEALKVWAGINSIINKAQPSEKIQESRFEIEKPTLTEAQIKRIADQRNKLLDEMFGDLKDHDLSIADKVNFECSQLPQSERDAMIKILTDRVSEYRSKPIRSFRFKKK